jgi:hypothetical protein
VEFDCNIRFSCERNHEDTNCVDAKNSEADVLAPLIAIVAKYAISRGNTFYLLNVGGKSSHVSSLDASYEIKGMSDNDHLMYERISTLMRENEHNNISMRTLQVSFNR